MSSSAAFNLSQVLTWGPERRWAFCRFTPSGSTLQTLVEDYGVASVSRSNAGIWTVQLRDTKILDLVVLPDYVENDTTHYHYPRADSYDLTAGTFVLTHKAVAFASVASGPSASDTVDQMSFVACYRVHP